MKTQITKQNAVVILENLIRFQRLSNKIGAIMDTTCDEWCVNLNMVITALFNIEEGETDDVMDACFDAFYDAVNSSSGDYLKLAEKMYNKCLRASLAQEKEQKEGIVPGVISLLKGSKYQIKGEFGLET